MKTKEELETTGLVEILNEIHSVSMYQDGIMMLVREEPNPDVRNKLSVEYDKAQNYYLMLNAEIYRRWGFDCDHPYEEKKIRK